MANGDSGNGATGAVLTILKQQGLATLIVCVLLWKFCFDWAPDVVRGHVDLLEATTGATERLTVIQEQNAETLSSVAEFMGQVGEEHARAEEKIDRNHEAILKKE